MSIQVSVNPLQSQMNRNQHNWGHDLVHDENLEGVLYFDFEVKCRAAFPSSSASSHSELLPRSELRSDGPAFTSGSFTL